MTDWIEGRVVGKHQWNDDHFSLRIDAEMPQFLPGQFTRIGMDLDGERVVRPYSLVNTAGEQPLEIFFNLVPEGPLTEPLANLQPGDTVWVAGKAGGMLTLAELPETTKDLWLIATGTGVGPFLSILKSSEVWERCEHLTLVYGVRYARDLAYGDLITKLQAEHGTRFSYVPIVSREDRDGALRGRIPAHIENGDLERLASRTLDAGDSHVMLCGNAGMIADVSAVLAERGMKRHTRREPGQVSTEKYH